MNDQKEHFQAFSDSRLIEIVKNARQFGYDDSTRNAALEVLKERGISEEDLQLTGNLTNYKYDYARELYKSYTVNSRVALFAYGVLLVFEAIIVFRLVNIDKSGIFYLLFYPGMLLLYFIALVRSFLDHLNFYKAAGKELGLGDQLIYFIVGMPFYIFMFFFYKSQMKETMKMV